MSVAGLLLWAARGVHFMLVLFVLGASLFRQAVAPAFLAELDVAFARRIELRQDRLLSIGLIAALVSSMWWFGQETVVISGATRFADWIGALRPVLFETQFGHMMLVRDGLLLAATIALQCGRRPVRFGAAAVLAAAAAAAQVFVSHGAAAGGSRGATIMAVEGIHIVAAGIWLGSLLPLLAMLTFTGPRAAAIASRRFSPMGIGCVLLIAFSAAMLAFLVVQRFARLLNTDYAHLVLIKLGFFLALLAPAAANRLVFTPGLAGRDCELSRQRLIWSVWIECVLGVSVVLAAAKLALLDPSGHVGHHHS